jgi:nucleoside-diphosphate-sugar epimerase
MNISKEDRKNLKGKSVALIGGAGFIGHNLALDLKKFGVDVEIIDGLAVNNLLYLNDTGGEVPKRTLYTNVIQERLKLLDSAGIPLHVQDARDYFKLSQVLERINPDVIVLLAAVSHANKSNKNPYDTFDHSLRTLENALDFARSKVKHFIYFSSSMVYGDFKTEVVDEETPCNPLGIYGALKYSGEKLVIAYNQVFELPYTIIRPSALYGERCISRRVSQIFVENAMEGEAISINGDGNERLDFTYIKDLVQGIAKVISRREAQNQIFNLTYGQSRSLKDLAAIIQYEFPDIPISFLPRDALMPERGTLSVEKAKSLIGYEPQCPLEVGVKHYIKWYREFFSNHQS